jgi:hypothetical protein
MQGTHWRARPRACDGPGQPGEQVLQVWASGPMDFLQNHLETTLKAAARQCRGRPASEISYRAKWLGARGCWNTRLYSNGSNARRC